MSRQLRTSRVQILRTRAPAQDKAAELDSSASLRNLVFPYYPCCAGGARQWRTRPANDRKSPAVAGASDLGAHLNLDASRGRERPHGATARGEIEAIKIHHFVPRGHEVTHELLLRVVTSIDFGERSELSVRTKDEVDGGGGRLDLARGAIATLVDVRGRGGCPFRAHVQKVHEKVVAQSLGPLR